MATTTIATFNVNSINARLQILVDWLRAAGPDVVLLQETKCVDEAFPHLAFRELGYEALTHGQKSYNGVAILAKGGATRSAAACPATRRTSRPATWRPPSATCASPRSTCPTATRSAPTSSPTSSAGWTACARTSAGLLEEGVPLVLGGDYNVIPEPRTATTRRPGRATRSTAPRAAAPSAPC
jgi:exodeoxyribonuclease-3